MNLRRVYYGLGTLLLDGEMKKIPAIVALQNLLWENATSYELDSSSEVQASGNGLDLLSCQQINFF